MKSLGYELPASGELVQLADDLYWCRCPLPFRLNHVNLYILDTDDGWCLIDTGVHNQQVDGLWQHLLAGPLSHQPVSRLIVTHHHIDHIGHSGVLARQMGLKVEMSPDEAEHAQWLYHLEVEPFQDLIAQTYRRYGLPDSAVAAAQNGGHRFRKLTAPLAAVTALKDGDVITTRSGHWQVRSDRGHSYQHLSFYDDERELFLAGDFLLPRISPNISADIRNPDADLLGDYLIYLDDMTQLNPEVKIFPGHDWPFCHAHERAAALITHHQMRLKALSEAAVQADLTTFDAMAVLFGRDFSDHELYFASGEARAHLNHLVSTHQLMRCSDDEAAERFSAR